MKKQYYEVRIREKIGPDKWVKKSKFYLASNSQEAVSRYKGLGHIMYAEKVPREKVLGIGEFFSLGDKLLKEFKGDNNGTAKETTDGHKRNSREWRRSREEVWS